MVHPVVLGVGERLFGEKAVRLVDTKAVGDGVAILTYAPVPDPAQGERHVPEMTSSETE